MEEEKQQCLTFSWIPSEILEFCLKFAIEEENLKKKIENEEKIKFASKTDDGYSKKLKTKEDLNNICNEKLKKSGIVLIQEGWKRNLEFLKKTRELIENQKQKEDKEMIDSEKSGSKFLVQLLIVSNFLDIPFLLEFCTEEIARLYFTEEGLVTQLPQVRDFLFKF